MLQAISYSAEGSPSPFPQQSVYANPGEFSGPQTLGSGSAPYGQPAYTNPGGLSGPQNFGMGNRVQFIPLLKEIYVDAKGIFVKDAATQFARATGGHEFYFLKQKGLEEAVQRISTEIRSHYMISYKPNNQTESGYHTLEVSIDRSNMICKTRPGYWLGGGVQ